MSTGASDFKFVLSLGIRVTCILLLCVSARAVPCGNYPFSTSSFFIPEFKWTIQELWQCLDSPPYVHTSTCSTRYIEPERVKPPGMYKACTNAPSIFYPCSGSPEDGGCQCNGACLPFSANILVGSTLQPVTFPSECRSAILSLEDTYSPVGTFFVNSENPTSDYACTSDLLRAEISVKFGVLDVFNTQFSCSPYVMLSPQQESCSVSNQTVLALMGYGDLNEFVSITYFRQIEDNIGPRSVHIIGNWQQLNRSMNALLYQPYPNQNTNRLRNYNYNPDASVPPNIPFEVMDVNVYFATPRDPRFQRSASGNEGGPWYPVGSLSQLVHIVDVDDEPIITNPSLTYVVPEECYISNKESLPQGWLSPACNFGLYYTSEDSTDTVIISGIVISDVDIDETCQPNDVAECNKLDVLFKIYKGTMLLNTRADLNFVSGVLSDREGFLFTGTLTNIAAAVKVVYYNVDLPQLIGKPGSTVLHYNTQNSGNKEYMTIIVDDQGYCGWTGVYKTKTTQVNITVVAVNNAPQIQGPNIVQYQALEDELLVLASDGEINVTDVDVDEVITSSLAQKIWMNSSRYVQYLNKVQVTASLTYGVLKVGYLVAPYVQLVENDNVTFATIKNLKYGHDLCRALPHLKHVNNSQPYSVVCVKKNQGSTACPTGKESGCICQQDGNCHLGDDVTLSLQKQDSSSRSESNTYLDNLMASIDLLDRNCGGMPVFASPNNFSFGSPCENDAQCSSIVNKGFAACSFNALEGSGNLCRCCVNISQVCQSDSDCSKFNDGSPCGCVAQESGPGICGPYGLSPDGQRNTTLLISFPAGPKYFGTQCRYQGPDSYMCKAAMYVTLGTQLPQYYQSVSIDSPGSHSVSVISDINTATILVNSFVFLSALNWNRLFRIPIQDRNPLTFNIEQDTFDVFTLVVNDLGNSGGGSRQELSVTKSVNILVSAVNDPPIAIAPVSVLAIEDVPYYFLGTLQIADPDSPDYGFSTRILTVNLTSLHGRLFLNEKFLQQKPPPITFYDWRISQEEYRGLHHTPPIYGNGCQFKQQCSDDSTDTKYGFYGTPWYGVVYSPMTAGGQTDGCGFCPADAGNKFISISGTLTNINEALSQVTYLSDPNFNTRYGIPETITLSVNDNGAIGENPSPSLMTSTTVNVIVESVNDRPLVGRRIQVKRLIRDFTSPSNDVNVGSIVTDYEFLPINQSIYSACELLAPSSSEYTNLCNVATREYIDVDEDTQFYITPQYLWINDVDANESLEMQVNNRRFCCEQHGADGCFCGGSCMCGSRVCSCKVPNVCSEDLEPWGAGQILIDLKVQNGLLTFLPPPGRNTYPVDSLAFLMNITDLDVQNGGPTAQCPDQSKCAVNVSRLTIRTPILIFQAALQDGYLSYRGSPSYQGPDTLSIWVDDQGYTDECYNRTLKTKQVINIRVVGINDPPDVLVPDNVLVYPSNLQCYVDFGQIKTNDNGLLESCVASPGDSAVPPTSSSANPIFISDVDINSVPYGNMTLYLTIGTDQDSQGSAGTFFLPSILGNSTGWYEQYAVSGLSTTVIHGKLDEINQLLTTLRYNGDPTFTGYVPFVVLADDMYNFGECSGDHKCGYLQSVCYDPSLAGPHQPALRGTSKQIIDVMIGASSVCLSASCEACNSESGCGWCPGVCQSQGGSCMAGSASGPAYEACRRSSDGRGWRQCQATPFDFLTMIAAVSGSIAGGGLLFFMFFLWVRRRHGSIKAYIFKKGRDFAITARRLHVMPPKTANYNQFLLTSILAVAIIVIVQLPAFQNHEPTCNFHSNFFMDGKTSAIYMALDNCVVNFVPTSSRPPPESNLKAIMIKFALPSDPLIELDANTCSPNKTFVLNNNRPDSVKYLGYYCSIEVVVPVLHFVIPDMSISATGTNLTTVRTGPPFFELNFGPNSFSLTGNTLNAMVDSIRVKTFTYSVIHGRLVAKDLQASKQATFTSEDADMSVTTSIQTSVRFWQKTANLVCLTAAPGSLYVHDSCNQVCTLKNSNQSSGSRRRKFQDSRFEVNSTTMRTVLHDRDASLRILGETTITVSGLIVTDPVAGDPRLPYTCTGDPSVDSNWLCKHYDPVALALQEPCPQGTGYLYKSQVPQITGCTDLEFCVVTETSQCLCKPTCDLDKSLNPPGICNAIGQCCQNICAGYSSADLFPTPNQPQCPPSGLWCTGKLDQQFTFTSTSGQIALEVLPTCATNVSGSAPLSCGQGVNSFSGKVPAESVFPAADILPADKIVLNQVFHVGGGAAPRQEWFVIKTAGPGIPDDEFGQFVWINSVRHFVILPWLLELFSFGLFVVQEATASVRFSPGYCPGFVSVDPTAAFDERLVQVRTAILDTLQAYPSGSLTPIPSSSLLAYVPTDGPPIIFLTDVNTNTVTATSFDVSNYAELLAMLGFIVGLPLSLSIFGLVLLVSFGKRYLEKYRNSVALREWASRQFSALLSGKGQINMLDVPLEIFVRTKAKTNFYFILEDFLGLSADNSLTIQDQWRAVTYDVIVTILPAVFVNLFADKLFVLHQTNRCQYRFDLCACLEETDGYLQFASTLKLMIYIYFFTAMLELGLHILTVEYSRIRRILRSCFYVLFLFMVWLSMTIIFLILVSIVVGFIVQPTAASIYAVTISGTLGILISIAIRTQKHQIRVRKNIEALIAKYRLQNAKKLPKQVLDTVMGTHIAKAMHENGLNALSICTKVVVASSTILFSCFFLFIGFSQFTDMADLYATLINNFILSSVLIGTYKIFVNEADPEDMKRDSEELAKRVAKTLQNIIDMLARQMEIASGIMQEHGIEIVHTLSAEG